MADSRTYTIRGSITNPGAVSMVSYLTARSTKIVECSVTKSQASPTTGDATIQLIMQTTAPTGTSFTPLAVNDGDVAAAGTALINCTAEGTAGTIRRQLDFNVLNGYYELPTPNIVEKIDSGGRVNLKFAAAPPAATYDYLLKLKEE